MAIETGGSIFRLSGKVGNLVFRVRNGKQIISARPSRFKGLSAIQRESTQKFKQAVAYATQATKHPLTQSLYAQRARKGKSAHNLAVADFFTPPVIREIFVYDYSGLPGNVIAVDVDDDFMVSNVHVWILNANDEEIEEGIAEPDQLGRHWLYTVQRANTALSGSRIIVAALDFPGNMNQQEIRIP